jgi:hypothetical protein
VALETGTYIDDLVATNPTGSDPKSEGDDHLRLLKSTIKATFPNIDGAMTATQEELNALSDFGQTFKNVIRNNRFLINQREVTGSVVLAANDGGHDCWKGGAAGCTYTFAASGGYTTLTISAGTLVQIIEGDDLVTETYTLTWTGTAQASIDGGAYGDSGMTASVTAGTNVAITFGTGTVGKVQFERGTTGTAFEVRPKSVEFDLCAWRYERKQVGSAGWFIPGLCDTTTSAIGSFDFRIKRTEPSIAFNGAASGDWYVRKTAANVTCTNVTAAASSTSSAKVTATVASGLTAGQGALIGALNESWVSIAADL